MSMSTWPAFASILFFCLGNASVAQTEILSFEGDTATPTFGWHLRRAGDLNGDGTMDLFVGAPGPGSNFRGVAQAVSGADGSTLLRIEGSELGDAFGFAVGNGADVDGDGVPDLVVGAPADDSGGTDAGRIVLISGATGLLLKQWTGAAPEDWLGGSVDIVGDLDGDGFLEIAAGAPGSDIAGVDAGAVHVFSGGTGSQIYFMGGGSPGDQFGSALAAAGDINLSGSADLMVGAPASDAFGFGAGEVRVYEGGTGSVLLILGGAAAGAGFGTSVASAGDLDGDGRPDLLVGAPEDPTYQPRAGSIQVLSGKNGSVLRTSYGDGIGHRFGQAVEQMGDLDFDGLPEFAGGADVRIFVVPNTLGIPPSGPSIPAPAPGYVKVCSGFNGSVMHKPVGPTVSGWFGWSLTGAGDLNGDGFDDFAVASPFEGDGRVRCYTGAPIALRAEASMVSASAGISVRMDLFLGPEYATKPYLLLGSASGSVPGTPLPGGLICPLNTDWYTLTTLFGANGPNLQGFSGILDGRGAGVASIIAPPGALTGLVGVSLHHAFIALGTGFDAVSNAISIYVLP